MTGATSTDIKADERPKQSALVIGATGAVGSVLLKDILQSKYFNRVGEFGRHVTDAAKLPAEAQGKLEQKIIDFEHLDAATLREGHWDVVFITLGTSRGIAGTPENFEKIDREYVLNAAKAAKTEDNHPQRLVYVSVTTSNPESGNLYLRSKGLTEKGLAEIGYSDAIIFRPGFLTGTTRAHSRPGEWAWRPLISVAGLFSSSIAMNVHDLSKSMVIAGALGSAALQKEDKETASWDGPSFTAISNAAAKRLHQRVYM